jgi:aryl-alcohol dehydrogenase-like predicted oxidoreductase
VLATKLGNRCRSGPTRALLAHLDAARSRGQPAPAADRPHRHLYLHRDFNGIDLEEPLRALDDLLREGKIRYWGLSNFRGWRIAEMVHLAPAAEHAGPVVCQPYYNLLNRMPEVEILPACAHHGIGVVPYSPVARGVLTGKYLPGPPVSRAPRRPGRQAHRRDRIPRRESLPSPSSCRGMRRPGVTLAQFATAWVLANRAVSSVIAGPAHAGPVAETTCRRWTAPSRPTTRPWSTAWWRRATRPHPATPTTR